jgi:hypothetical protein
MARLTLSNVQPVAQTSQILAHAPARHASIPAHVPQFPPHPFGPHVLPVQSGLHEFFFLFFRFRRFFFLFFLFFLAFTSVAPNSAPVASAARDSPNSPCATVRRPKNPASARAKRSNGGCTWSDSLNRRGMDSVYARRSGASDGLPWPGGATKTARSSQLEQEMKTS